MWGKWCKLCCQSPTKDQSQLRLKKQRCNNSNLSEGAALLDTTCKLVENNHPTIQIENKCVNNKKCAATQELREHSSDQQETIQLNGSKKSIMTVSFTAPVSPVKRTPNVLCNSQETGGRSASVANRPTWTLHDVLSSPHNYDFDRTQPPDSNQKLMYTSFPSKPLEQWSQSSTQSFTKITDEDDETTFVFMYGPSRPGSSAHRVHYSQPHPPYPTFFLPRISTDPATVGDVITDDGTVNSTKSFPPRRGSMIVRSGRTTNSITLGNLPEQPSPGAGVEGFIVTPFAQILVSMQKIRSAFIRLTAAQSTHRFGVISSAVPEPGLSDLLMPENSDYKSIANETLEELEWCLKQLENIQTKRPVSDMAFSKFKRLLNKELNSFGEADKSRHEISAYICGTFLEDEKDAQANQEIEQMLERRRSSEQSHGSGGPQDHTLGSSFSKHRTSMLGNDVSGTVRVKSGDISNTELQSMKSETIHLGDRTSKPVDASAIGQVASVEAAKGEDTNSLENSMPVNGIVTPNDQLLDERFTQTLDTWGADIFEIDRLSDGHALTTTAYRIFQKRDLMRIFCIDPATLVRYLLKVESSYHSDVPYHNSLHAADVTQTSHYLLQAEPLEDVFSDLEILAVIFASAVHDVDHPGLTNQYLINTGHDLALQYNDTSVLENHHLYIAFKLLNEPDCDIFSALTAKKRQTLRRVAIELVLATDMSKHMSLLADLRTMVEAKKVSGSGVLNLDNYSDRIQILQNMIHCADLSNPAKPLRLNRKWTSRLMEEFFRQGDKERSLKLEISPMCDRESVAVEKSQVSFIDFVAHPLLESWCDLVHPSAQLILDILADNRDWYENQSEGPKVSGASKGRPKLATAEEDEEELVTCS